MRPTVSIGSNLGGRASGFLIKACAFLIAIAMESAQGIAASRHVLPELDQMMDAL
jgi:hypothetical protein